MNKNEKSERAKLYMPFAAVKGLDKALREKERILVDKIDLSEESKENISNYISTLKKGMIVKVVHYENMEYIETTGVISNIDFVYFNLTIVMKKINFDDIYKIDIVSEFI